ncbi:Thioredoxin-disulfide reductase [Rickettsiales endosymbiont of Paramecium tredecaurelia]|uniref:thioredoxin-disulfide reductase n=1 Tax=Candidatus Sarmatiella mevalonica TaxID=2770581 RepID=UPI001924BEED|nr:thioredoxin-disulfide reductase [Candidatus Sarmatiella mevalonica]MBL3284996.1 Thioredoxin-disulfide reductase [Candidatus Sarmatiella mevalonica]
MSTQQEFTTKTCIVGSGPAGLSAAIYAARAALDPIVVAGSMYGGQLMITTNVENYPGFASPIQGPWLMEQMMQQAKNVGAQILQDDAVEIDYSTSPFVVKTSNKTVITTQTLIISTGASAKWLGLDSEAEYRGFGVSGCATCDAFFFKNKEVVVVGGGNTAAEEALHLAHHASKVTLIHRRNALRAEKILQQRVFANPKIEVIWNSVVEEILGQSQPKSVTGIRLKDMDGKVTDLKCDGVFVAIGYAPNTSLFLNSKNNPSIALDKFGYIITAPDSTATNIPGVFAAGDVQDRVFRQAVTAAATGCMAALEVERFLG